MSKERTFRRWRSISNTTIAVELALMAALSLEEQGYTAMRRGVELNAIHASTGPSSPASDISADAASPPCDSPIPSVSCAGHHFARFVGERLRRGHAFRAGWPVSSHSKPLS
jgi:hypothetical protein